MKSCRDIALKYWASLALFCLPYLPIQHASGLKIQILRQLTQPQAPLSAWTTLLINGRCHGNLPSRSGLRMPVNDTAIGAQQMLIANSIDPSSLHPKKLQQFVNAPPPAQQKSIAIYSQYLHQHYRTQAGSSRVLTSAVPPWPTAWPPVAQHHKPEGLHFPRETYHHNRGPIGCIAKGRRGKQGKGIMQASGGCKRYGNTHTS